MTPLITLTTDFGLSDEYAGVMKGVIYTRCPGATIVDLTHGIRPQEVGQAARVIASAYRYFPLNTIHVVVVDPGVGSNRRIILLEAAGHLFLAPDNGVMTLLLPQTSKAYEVSNSDLFLQPVSHTFHGRDIFAPVAAHLACNLPPHSTGREIASQSLVSLALPTPALYGNSLQGAVTDIDHFGNLITNIDRETAHRFCAGDWRKLRVSAGALTITGVATAYNAVAIDLPVALFGSRDLLEIGIYQGNASKKLQLGLDSKVSLSI
ncbi:MAG: SAM-dependent chlorinase/fluorinase [Proteobacteria bacterium]|nr:SAM-dependent chlorinase/fluorinase [Pseudomonadota bacterium]